MADTLSASLTAALGWTLTETDDLSSPVDSGEVRATLSFADGTGNSQADLLYRDQGSISSSGSPVTLDLTALTRTVPGGTVAVNFVKVKAIVIVNLSSTVAINVGDAATSPFVGPWNGDTDGLSQVGPSGIMVLTAPVAGWVTAGGVNLKLAIPSGSDVGYKIVIIGTSA